jgi:hypothetical protein
MKTNRARKTVRNGLMGIMEKEGGMDCRLIQGFSLRDGRGFAKVLHFHSHPSATLADVFHGCQFALANMGCIHVRGSTKAAFLFVSARIAQVPRIICHCATVLTCVCHGTSPF